MKTVVNLLPTMNSRDRVDNNISFMFNASNIIWQPLIKTKTEQKEKDNKRNGT